jgi:hypothetical protein
VSLVRVWSVTLDPGQRQPWHQHLLPYLIVPLTEGSNEMTFDDGRVRETHEKPGDAIWREPGIPHELLNRSDYSTGTSSSKSKRARILRCCKPFARRVDVRSRIQEHKHAPAAYHVSPGSGRMVPASSTMRNSTLGIANPDEPGRRRCGVLPITM